jgi:hypothetical protein
MTVSVTLRGTGSTNTGGETSLVASPNATVPHGSVIVLCCAYDNSAGAGVDPLSGITSSKQGLVWSNNTGAVNDPGAANAGITGRIFSATMTNGPFLSSDTITVSFSATTVARAWCIYQVDTSIQGQYAGHQNEAAAAQTSATPSITTATFVIGDAVIACVAREANGTRTADGDATNGTWTGEQSVGVGTTTGGAEIICEYKIVTATTAQTYNPTFGGASADGVNMWHRKGENAVFTLTFQPRIPLVSQLLPR